MCLVLRLLLAMPPFVNLAWAEGVGHSELCSLWAVHTHVGGAGPEASPPLHLLPMLGKGTEGAVSLRRRLWQTPRARKTKGKSENQAPEPELLLLTRYR